MGVMHLLANEGLNSLVLLPGFVFQLCPVTCCILQLSALTSCASGALGELQDLTSFIQQDVRHPLTENNGGYILKGWISSNQGFVRQGRPYARSKKVVQEVRGRTPQRSRKRRGTSEGRRRR